LIRDQSLQYPPASGSDKKEESVVKAPSSLEEGVGGGGVS